MIFLIHIQNFAWFTLMMFVFFSNFLEQHFKYLQTLFYLLKKTGLVVSKSKIFLFQTRIRFLAHYIFQGTITPIKKSLIFVRTFPDKTI
jgi:hypothetical protein